MSNPNKPTKESKSRQRGMLAFAIVALVLAAAFMYWQVQRNQPHLVTQIHVAPFGKALWLQQQKAKNGGGAAPGGGQANPIAGGGSQ